MIVSIDPATIIVTMPVDQMAEGVQENYPQTGMDHIKPEVVSPTKIVEEALECKKYIQLFTLS